MRDTDPMRGRMSETDLTAQRIAEAEEEPIATVASHVPNLSPRPQTPPPSAHLQPLVLGDTSNIDRRTADRFRRGELGLEGRIDLHGMTQNQAHQALAGFVHRAWMEGRRCVLVITGKGGPHGIGVLRQMVPRWLADSGMRPMVLAVRAAQLRDGGDGALYVLIKRRRDRMGYKGNDPIW